MATLYLTHSCFLDHDTGPGHPERPDRMRAVEKALSADDFAPLIREETSAANDEAIARAHPQSYIDLLREIAPEEGEVYLTEDTPMSPGTLKAALHGAGAAVRAVDAVMNGEAQTAFCGVRPPGHHAEPKRAMGFCFFGNAAIAAKQAQVVHGAERVAVVDFDVHHGNGTQALFWAERDLLFASTHQMPLFPGTGHLHETGIADNIVNAPLRDGDDGQQFREAFNSRVLPALESHRPDLVIISAGFDAHYKDPLG
ncbi:MAG: histone deacetylase family protein, partial [Hyphomicrobiales bacterium]|nr:histone deacetylase family protein [Hyphomicrobiales bacterium]